MDFDSTAGTNVQRINRTDRKTDMSNAMTVPCVDVEFEGAISRYVRGKDESQEGEVVSKNSREPANMPDSQQVS
jgi:hypothetical protein